jgi:hypothetical protein
MTSASRRAGKVSGGVPLRIRNGVYRRLQAEEERDLDADGVPDVYLRTPHRAGRQCPASADCAGPRLAGG